ncbi:27493_t:CDS:2 [Gigaspora margarita]|uniref:27493_t:CDS:1 n=1 Tax=Gigaspora margarita TaxID=4874 RepID=A0ABN7UNK7_GIGMA|nr:27493_t:CDS:2 [Gigaspora margarita]
MRGNFSNQSNQFTHAEPNVDKGKKLVYPKHNTDTVPPTPFTSNTSIYN